MTWTTLISVEELATRLDDCVVVDCRHDLLDPEAGRRAYEAGHIPGAHFLHLDADLAGPVGAGTGRHPLPDAGALREKLAAIGAGADTQLVAYDAAGGSTAARLWWLARWLGHRAVAVLDGGLPAWQAAGFPVDAGPAAARPAATLPPRPSLTSEVGVEALVRNLRSAELVVVDARSTERFRGESEPIDPVAGHIPGSLSRPLQENLRPDGRFRPAEVIRQSFDALLAGRPAETVVHSCGSGVSACHNLLAMEFAGLGGSKLYPGSWSQWCSDRSRPIASGDAD